MKKNAGWDSIKHLEIIMAIEEEFDIRFSSAEVTKVKKMLQIYTQLLRKKYMLNNNMFTFHHVGLACKNLKKRNANT